MKITEIDIRVRYSETDQMGVVYHGNYAQYFEMGRVEWLRNLGISYKKLEEEGVMLPVVSLSIEYKKPALYDELLKLRTMFRKCSGVRIEFEYELLNEQGELLTTATSVLVFMNASTRRPIGVPDTVKERLKLL
ncbi:acyl-CoA thioesterase [Myroides guanonis]|uniref:Acyl-CoA thioester hydrolase n=1 Tax=Myroides guanonis TaxID=1150112 RepID=A0A1I3RWF1_9FLAO|nr:thioesterase family protein [Myroides guanonis]SFJ50212.1 acyl-CoA thioester hydrolase [Myroides guanonis]